MSAPNSITVGSADAPREAWAAIRGTFKQITKHLDEVTKQWDALTLATRASEEPRTMVLGGKVGGEEPLLMLSRPSDITSASFLTDRSQNGGLNEAWEPGARQDWLDPQESLEEMDIDDLADSDEATEGAGAPASAALVSKLATNRSVERLDPNYVVPLTRRQAVASRDEQTADAAAAPASAVPEAAAPSAEPIENPQPLAGMSIVKLSILREQGLFDQAEYEQIREAIVRSAILDAEARPR